jgi:predicted DNA-binding WGR domain protein
MRKVLLEFSEGTSDKFWEGIVEGCQFKARFGRQGTSGQEKSWDFATNEAAAAQLEKVLKEKLAKGYQLINDVGTVVASATTTSAQSTHNPSPVASLQKQAKTVATPEKKEKGLATADVELSDYEQAFNFHKRRQRDKPKPASFDRPAMLAKMKNYGSVQVYRDKWITDFERGRVWSREEAHLWFVYQIALLKAERECHTLTYDHHMRPDRPDLYQECLDKEMQGIEFGKCTLADAQKHIRDLRDTTGGLSPSSLTIQRWNHSLGAFTLIVPLIFLLPLCEFLMFWQELWDLAGPSASRSDDTDAMFSVLRGVVVPFITAEELAELRNFLAAEIEKTPFIIHSAKDPMPLPYLIAGIFGMEDLVEPALSSIPDGTYQNPNAYSLAPLARPDLLVFALSDKERIRHHCSRLKITLWSQQQCLAWLAHFGAENYKPVLPFASHVGRHYMQHKWHWKDATFYLTPIFRVKTAAAARDIFDLAEEPGFRTPCYGWLRNHLHLALPAALAVANENGPRANEAKSFIRDMVAQVDPELLDAEIYQACKALNAELEELRQSLTRTDKSDWFAQLLEAHPVKKTQLPNWLLGAQLEPIIIEGYVLSNAETTTILYALKQSSDNAIHPLLLALRQETPRFAFDKFVWNLFERWLREDAAPKDNWCMLSVGVLGSDSTIAKLLPLMKEWRANANHARAGFGLKCIRAADTDASLMIINKVSQSASLKSMRTTALALINEIAIARNLSPAELEDRIVPSCGLDDNGGRTFDYGKRKFHFVLGADLKPFVKDELGKVRDDLPAPNQDDDPDLAPAAQAGWKDMKKLIKVTAKAQAQRLEMAMVSGRRWSPTEFEQFFVQHPLMWHLSKPLIWGVYDSSEKLVGSFRVTDERDFADSAEKSFTFTEGQRVGIVHPLELANAELNSWGQIMTDYELAPPFLQLNRASTNPPADEVKASKFSIFDGLEFEPVFIPSILEKRSWERFQTIDGGMYIGHFKYFSGKNITAALTYNGIYSGDPKYGEAQKIEQVFFLEGNVGKDLSYGTYGRNFNEIAYDNVDPIVLSEIYTDLSILAAKGKKV